MVACRYGISLLVFNLRSHSFAALTRELSSLNTQREIPYLRASMYYSLFMPLYFLGLKFMLSGFAGICGAAPISNKVLP